MYFLACLLTIQFDTPQTPLATAWHPQLRRDLQAAYFPTEKQGPHLLAVACVHRSRDQWVLRLALAHEQRGNALAHFLKRVQLGQTVRLFQRRGQVHAVDFSDRVWAGISTWADFQASSRASSFHFTFATPLLTTSPGIEEQADALPFPEPETLFAPALEHWRRLSGPSLASSAQHMVQATRCVLATYRLQTVHIPALSCPGYLGWVEYTCLQPQGEAMHALWALARLAFFTGCGYETASGFGTARVVLRERGG